MSCLAGEYDENGMLEEYNGAEGKSIENFDKEVRLWHDCQE
jgi:hypothetical protein